jgi:hypothetical protein
MTAPAHCDLDCDCVADDTTVLLLTARYPPFGVSCWLTMALPLRAADLANLHLLKQGFNILTPIALS